ncbi:MAG: Ig domain-containing protein [Clostridia bacterium]|nr:Ig domain-containing protein [Clostridia bacterium]
MNELNNKTEMDAEELILAPETEIYEEARRIAMESAGKESALFFVEYDTNREEDFLALISEMGSTVEGEEEGTGALILSLNEDQLAFVKTLDYVERLRENRPVIRQAEEETLNIEAKSILTNQEENGILNSVEAMSLEADDGGVAVASEVATASVTSTCPESNTMATAIPLTIGTVKYGCICCPGAEQWYKFTVNESSTYTISTNKFTENYNLDTVGYLYDSCGNLLAQNDDHNLRLYFKIQAELEEGQTYYVKVMAKGNNTGSYSVKVENKIWVTDVTVHPTTVTMGVGDTAQLSATVSPANATDKRVFWHGFNNNVATVDFHTGIVTAIGIGVAHIRAYDWDQRSQGGDYRVYVGGPPVESVTLDRTKKTISVGDSEYLIETILPLTAIERRVNWESDNSSIAEVNGAGLVTAKAPGIVNITVKTVDGGYTATCAVTVDPRPKVVIEEEIEGGYKFFKAIFPENEGGLIWKSVGMDLEGMSTIIYQSHWNRYYFNQVQYFSENQLAFLYLFDPFGVTHYVKNNISHRFSDETCVYETCMFKDRVHTKIFGVYPRLIKVFPDNTASYYEYNPNISPEIRLEYYTDAEVLFGGHKIYDWLAVANLVINYGIPLITSLFTTIWGPLGAVLTTVELCQFAFFGGAVNDTLSSGMSSSLDEYLQCFIDKEENKHSFSKAFGWIALAFDFVTTIIEGMNVFTPSLADVVVYDKINRNNDYRVTLTNGQNQMTIKELYDYCDF